MIKLRGVTKYRHLVKSALLRDGQLIICLGIFEVFRQFHEWKPVSIYQFEIFRILFFLPETPDIRHVYL